MSSDRLGISEPRPAEEVIQSLNVKVLHRHLGHFGITEVSTEVCVCLKTVSVLLGLHGNRSSLGSLVSPCGDGGEDGWGLLKPSAAAKSLMEVLKSHRSAGGRTEQLYRLY